MIIMIKWLEGRCIICTEAPDTRLIDSCNVFVFEHPYHLIIMIISSVEDQVDSHIQLWMRFHACHLTFRLYNIVTFALAYIHWFSTVKKDKTHAHRKKYHHNKPTLTQLTIFFTVSSYSKNYVHWSFPRDENRPYQKKSTLTLFFKYLLYAHCTTTAVTVASCKKVLKCMQVRWW